MNEHDKGYLLGFVTGSLLTVLVLGVLWTMLNF